MTVHSCAVGNSGNSIAACSALWCAAEWSRKAVNEARPWWRRDSSSWKWVSQRDWEEPSLSAADPVIQRRHVHEPRAASRVWNTVIPPTRCLDGPSACPAVFGGYFYFMNLEKEPLLWYFKSLLCVFAPTHRSSEFWRDQTVDLQDRLQTPVRAEEMQP